MRLNEVRGMDISMRLNEDNYVSENLKKIIVSYCEKGKFTEESRDKLIMLLTAPQIREILDDEMATVVSICGMEEKIEKSLALLGEMYKKRKDFDHIVSEDYMEKWENHKKRWGVNVEKYVDMFYENAKVHLVLKAVFEDIGSEVIKLLEKRICYRKYGKYGTLEGNYYCQSPIRDLYISNVSRGALYKRTPKDLKNKAEYDFDKAGRLILYKWHLEENELYFTEIVLYGESDVLRIRYENKIKMISIQNYEGDVIVKYEKTSYNDKKLRDMDKETYEYKDGQLSDAWTERYIFPNFYGERRKYIFKKDEEGLLEGYDVKTYCGDGEVDTIKIFYENRGIDMQKEFYEQWENYIEKLSDKKRKDTGKNAVRWKRPNLF